MSPSLYPSVSLSVCLCGSCLSLTVSLSCLSLCLSQFFLVLSGCLSVSLLIYVIDSDCLFMMLCVCPCVWLSLSVTVYDCQCPCLSVSVGLCHYPFISTRSISLSTCICAVVCLCHSVCDCASLSLSLSLSLSRSLSHSLTHSLTIHSLTHSLALTHSLTHSLTLSLPVRARMSFGTAVCVNHLSLQVDIGPCSDQPVHHDSMAFQSSSEKGADSVLRINIGQGQLSTCAPPQCCPFQPLQAGRVSPSCKQGACLPPGMGTTIASAVLTKQ